MKKSEQRRENSALRGWRGSGDLRVVRSVVRNLRRKLGDDAANPDYIFTVRQVGYRMPKPNDP